MITMPGLLWLLMVCGIFIINESSEIEEASAATCELLDKEAQDTLREQLRHNSCLREVEIVEPHDVTRAARLFHRDGFVVIGNAISEEQSAALRDRCGKVADKILEKDPRRIGNRGPYRYSLGPPHKTGHLLHYPEFAELVDTPTITPILKAIFGNDKFICRGARGDFNLPGAPYQSIHSDVWRAWLPDPAETEYTDTGRLDERDLPIFYVVANYIIGNLTALNAPIRQIPNTQNSHRPMPVLDDEPLWMKRSTLCPIPAGSAIIRDPRAWHGGTPNLSDGVRCMPNIEYYSYWYRNHDKGQMTRSMPREIYDTLSPFGKELCREVVALPGEEIDVSMKDEVTYLMGDDMMPCYRKMGMADEEIQLHIDQGRYDNLHGNSYATQRHQFYGRKTHTKPSTKFGKDEL